MCRGEYNEDLDCICYTVLQLCANPWLLAREREAVRVVFNRSDTEGAQTGKLRPSIHDSTVWYCFLMDNDTLISKDSVMSDQTSESSLSAQMKEFEGRVASTMYTIPASVASTSFSNLCATIQSYKQTANSINHFDNEDGS